MTANDKKTQLSKGFEIAKIRFGSSLKKWRCVKYARVLLPGICGITWEGLVCIIGKTDEDIAE